MAKPINNPHLLLENEGISKNLLSSKATTMLSLYDRAQGVAVKQPKSSELQAQADKAGELACKVISQDINRIRSELKNDVEDYEKKTAQKAQSKKIVQKSEQVLGDLELCRQKLREDHKRRKESGEIAPPKKKTLVTKLRNDLGRMVNLIPDKLKTNADVIEKTEKALLKFMNELKNIWGINKIKPIEDEITAKIDKLQEQAN